MPPPPPAPRPNLFGRVMYGAMVGWFKSRGWRAEGPLPPDRKFVLVGAPHTSNWDFLVFVGTIAAFGLKVHFVGKHTLFRWPFGSMMRGLGGVSVDRSESRDLVHQMADQFAAHDEFILIVAPEGTRGKTDRWRTGFYRIALAAGVPIVCVGPDYARRCGGDRADNSSDRRLRCRHGARFRLLPQPRPAPPRARVHSVTVARCRRSV